jgi:hypothetical protein
MFGLFVALSGAPPRALFEDKARAEADRVRALIASRRVQVRGFLGMILPVSTVRARFVINYDLE